MAYFYVKNSLGTRTVGGGLTQQTGSFTTLGAASVYATIAAAITDGATAGDFILCSDLHDFDSAAVAITWSGPTTGVLTIMSVDDANCDAYSAGATERTTSGTAADVQFSGLIACWGFTLTSVDDYKLLVSGSELHGYDMTFGPMGSTSTLRFDTDAQMFQFYNPTFDLSSANARFFFPDKPGVLRTYGGVITRSGGVGISYITSGGWTAGGCTLEMYGTDLSEITTFLFNDIGGSLSADDRMHIRLDLCQLNATVAFFDETPVNGDNDILISRCSSASATAEYQFFSINRGGEVSSNTTFYRDGSTAYDESGQKVSLEVVGNTDNSRGIPFTFDFPTIDAALSSASTDTLRIYVLSADTLTDADLWAVAIYPDGTNKNIGNIATSTGIALGGSNMPDPLQAGTTLTTNTEAWTGRTTENRYQIDIDTSGDVGADCVPTIRLYFAKASSTIYLDTTVDVVA